MINMPKYVLDDLCFNVMDKTFKERKGVGRPTNLSHSSPALCFVLSSWIRLPYSLLILGIEKNWQLLYEQICGVFFSLTLFLVFWRLSDLKLYTTTFYFAYPLFDNMLE